MNKKQLKTQIIVKALSKCFDPEINANIVDIGLIYGINIDNKNNIKLILTMTSPMCPFISMLMAQIQEKVEAIKNIGKLRVDLVLNPAWNPEMMEKELKIKLNNFY